MGVPRLLSILKGTSYSTFLLQSSWAVVILPLRDDITIFMHNEDSLACLLYHLDGKHMILPLYT